MEHHSKSESRIPLSKRELFLFEKIESKTPVNQLLFSSPLPLPLSPPHNLFLSFINQFFSHLKKGYFGEDIEADLLKLSQECTTLYERIATSIYVASLSESDIKEDLSSSSSISDIKDILSPGLVLLDDQLTLRLGVRSHFKLIIAASVLLASRYPAIEKLEQYACAHFNISSALPFMSDFEKQKALLLEESFENIFPSLLTEIFIRSQTVTLFCPF